MIDEKYTCGKGSVICGTIITHRNKHLIFSLFFYFHTEKYILSFDMYILLCNIQ